MRPSGGERNMCRMLGDEAGGGPRICVMQTIIIHLKDSRIYFKEVGSHWLVSVREITRLFAILKDSFSIIVAIQYMKIEQ